MKVHLFSLLLILSHSFISHAQAEAYACDAWVDIYRDGKYQGTASNRGYHSQLREAKRRALCYLGYSYPPLHPYFFVSTRTSCDNTYLNSAPYPPPRRGELAYGEYDDIGMIYSSYSHELIVRKYRCSLID